MSRETPAEWVEAIERLAPTTRTALVLGASDTGKTTFIAMLANAARALGRTTAIVDADLGQSEIGPPACVGLGVVEGPIALPRECRARSLAYVGAVSPPGRLLAHCAATHRMVSAARQLADLCLLDTTGFVIEPTAVQLKQAKIDLVQPDAVVAIERRAECESIVAPVSRSQRCTVVRIRVPRAVTRKSPETRAMRRQGNFASYFQHSEPIVLDMNEVALAGTWLNGSPALEPRELLFLTRALGGEAVHAELGFGRLAVLLTRDAREGARVQEVRERYRVRNVTITTAETLRHLLVGLQDSERETLGMGILEQVDAARRAISVVTPVRAAAAVRVAVFGLQRVLQNGKEMGAIRPGAV